MTRSGLELSSESFVVITDETGEQCIELALTNDELAAALKNR